MSKTPEGSLQRSSLTAFITDSVLEPSFSFGMLSMLTGKVNQL
jgi:hypothetical protein